MKKILKNVPYLIIALLIGVTVSYAGSLTPPGGVANTMYTLTDIFNLSIGTTSTEGTGAIDPTPGTIVGAGKTLTEVYEAIAGEINNLSPEVLATGTSAFGIDGEATLGTPAPTFALADTTQYKCEWLTVDPTQPDVTLETICGYHIGDSCSWTGSVCDGGDELKTPVDELLTWYAAKSSCSNSTAEGQSVGTWRLPTPSELIEHYLDNNTTGNPPTGFTTSYYWSSSTRPDLIDYAYNVVMGAGLVTGGYKDGTWPAHCIR